MRFEYVVHFDTGQQFKILLNEQNEIFKVLSIEQRELILPREISNKLFCCRFNDLGFQSYLWICSDLTTVYIEREELEDFFQENKISRELFVKLRTKEHIDRYLSLMRL